VVGKNEGESVLGKSVGTSEGWIEGICDGDVVVREEMRN